MSTSDNIEKAVIIIVEKGLNNPLVKKGKYPSLDKLAEIGSSGFVSTFKDCDNVILQLTGINYLGLDSFKEEVGPMKLNVLTSSTSFNDFGSSTDIFGKSVDEIFSIIREKLKSSTVIVVELPSIQNKPFQEADELVEMLLPMINNDNIAISCLFGYDNDIDVPTFPKPPPCVLPSWKVIGPNVVDSLTEKKPMMFFTASKKLTRVDDVTCFDEIEIFNNNGMGMLPICQYFREFSYYTGTSGKYGA